MRRHKKTTTRTDKKDDCSWITYTWNTFFSHYFYTSDRRKKTTDGQIGQHQVIVFKHKLLPLLHRKLFIKEYLAFKKSTLENECFSGKYTREGQERMTNVLATVDCSSIGMTAKMTLGFGLEIWFQTVDTCVNASIDFLIS